MQQYKLGSESMKGGSVSFAAEDLVPAAKPARNKAPMKHASMSNLGQSRRPLVVDTSSGPSLPTLVSPATPTLASHPSLGMHLASPEPQEKRSISRTISTYFKSLFNKQDESEGGSSMDTDEVPGAGDAARSPAGAVRTDAKPAGDAAASGDAGVQPRQKKKLASAVTFTAGSFGPGQASPKERAAAAAMLNGHISGRSSTAAIENEVAAAMRRAQSLTGRQNAPATLLAVSRDLPPRMVRQEWSLRDYGVVEKMYTGEHHVACTWLAKCKHMCQQPGVSICWDLPMTKRTSSVKLSRLRIQRVQGCVQAVRPAGVPQGLLAGQFVRA